MQTQNNNDTLLCTYADCRKPQREDGSYCSNKHARLDALTDEIRSAIETVIDYQWSDEEKHYHENNEPSDHIFVSLKLLQKHINKIQII